MPHIDINELHKERDKRSAVRNEIYDRVLQRCHSKIKSIAKLSDICFCFFEVPAYSYGLPAYNQIECIYYIVQILMEDGFKVEFTEPNILFISWIDKPKRKTLADIAGESRMPIQPGPSVRRTTQNYNVNNSLYHDGLSELEVKSNQIFRDDIYNPRQQNRGMSKGQLRQNLNDVMDRSRQSKEIGFRNNQMDSNLNRLRNRRLDGRLDGGMSNMNNNMNSGFVDFNPSGNNDRNVSNNDFKTISMDDNIKSFSFDTGKKANNKNYDRTQIKKAGFRSLFDDSSGESTYKKMKDDFNSVSLDDIDDQFGLGRRRSSSPAPQMSNNIGFSEFNL